MACSGGPDSTALFHLLRRLSEKWNFKLGLLHFNHYLRGAESRKDEQFVRKLATEFHVPCITGGKKVMRFARRDKESLEEASRKARYHFFVRAAKKARITKIALAHTLDDQAETVLMRMLQGTGLKGLLGIRGEIRLEKVRFFRPLLNILKREIMNYLKTEKIVYRLDSSNTSRQFLRNRLRRDWLPRFAREVNPRVVEALGRIPAIVKEECDWIEASEKEAWLKTFRKRLGTKVYLNRESYLSLPSPVQFRILNKALQSLDKRGGLGFDAWSRLRADLAKKRMRCSLPRDIDLDLTPRKLVIYKKTRTR